MCTTIKNIHPASPQLKNGSFSKVQNFGKAEAGKRISENQRSKISAHLRESFLCLLFAILATTSLYSQSSNQNYVKTTVPVSAVTTETALNNLSTSLKIEDITYFDGLGRPIQNVTKKASPLSKDIVQNTIYDQYGRTPRTYLPYVDNTVDGSYKTSATANQAGFYNTTYLIAHTTTPYADAVYDGSPMNKVVETSAPDSDWQLGQHTTTIEEGTNVANEVRLWQITGGDCISTSCYAANQLSKVKVTDPNGGYSYTYTDKLGKTIMVQRYVRSISKTVHVFTYTYYVYDDFGNLAYAIPPKAIELMTPFANYSVNWLTQDLVFKYVYDENQRLVEKKVPGAALQYIVYNQLNQPVLTQDGNLRAQNKWQFIKYDVLGRAIMTGIFDASSLPLYQTRSSAQAQLNANQTDIGESEVLQDISNPYGYTNITLPNQNLDILTVNFYDDYDFDNNGSVDYSFNTASMPCITTGSVVCTPFTNSATNRTRGFLTGSKNKVLDAANPVQWVTAASFYNADGQVSQVQSNDHLGGSYLTNMRYDFTGNLIHSVVSYTEVSSNLIQIINYFTYDKMGRLLRVDQKNNNDAPIVLSKEKYNELGQLIDKSLHSTNNGTSFIQSMDYRYNIHGWLTHINNSDLVKDMDTDGETGLPLSDGTNDDEGDLWGLQLKYNTVTTGVNGTGNKQYGGNVSEKHWKAASDNVKRAYGYTYDKLDRLTSSTYTEYNYGPSTWGTNANRFNENNITYDANGNILTLTRYGHQTASTFGQIDNLNYGYSGNVVTAINDASAVQSSNDFKDNGSSGSNEYTYDANGNMITNANKQISSIAYNHMNLPILVQFSSGNKIEYFYDAVGTRLRKKTTQVTLPAGTNEKKYSGVFEYAGNTLEAFYTAEGRCVPTGTVSPQYRYEYQYMDNTGNAVLAFSDLDNNGSVNASTEIIQQSHFYPFGMRMQGLSTPQIGPENKYKFGSKELQDEFGLNEYDFGARFYDPAIGRWGCVDPLADLASDWTPFRYGFNNPITVTDPNGMFEGEFEEEDISARVRKAKWDVITKEYKYEEVSNEYGDNVVLTEYIGGEHNDQYSVEHKGKTQWFGEAHSTLPPPGNFSDWYMDHMSEYETTIEAYRAWQSNDSYHEGEGFWDRTFRIMGHSSVEARREYGTGGYNMFGNATGAVESEVLNLGERANQIHKTVSIATQGRTTIAAANVLTAEGKAEVWIASSEKALRPIQKTAMKNGEIAIEGLGHAETTIINHAAKTGAKVLQVAASRPICLNCAIGIYTVDAIPASTLKTVTTRVLTKW